MNKIVLVTIFILLSLMSLKGQSFELGLVGSPNYAYRRAHSEKDLKFLYEGEKPRVGFGYGVAIIHRFTEKLAIETGIRYVRMGYSYGKQTVTNDDQTQKKVIESFHQFDFLNVPVKTELILFNNRNLSPIVKIGMNNYFFVGEWVEVDNNKESTNISSVRGYQPGISVSLGVSARINNCITGYFSPTLDYFPYSLYRPKDPVKKYLFSVGAELILSYRFSKGK